MAGITLNDVSNILEKIIRPAVEDQLYNRVILWNMFGGFDPGTGDLKNKNAGVLKTDMDNQTFYVPTLQAHSNGAVTIAEGGTLVSGKPQLDQAAISARYATGTFQITKQTLAIRDAGIAVRQLDFYMKQNVLAMAIDLNRQGYNDGSGTITTAAGSGTAATALTFTASPNGDIDYTLYTPPGTILSIGGAQATVATIVAKNQITLAQATTWSNLATIKKLDGAGGAVVEMDGLNEALSTTSTYQGINPSTDPSWVAAYVSNPGSSVNLALSDMYQAFLQANRTGNCKYIVMNMTEFLKYGSLLQGQLRFDYKEVLGGGWKGLDFMGGNAQVVLDYTCPDDHIYFLSPEYWTIGEMKPFEWEKGTDGVLLRIQGTLNYEATGTWFGNFGNFKRSANALLANRVG
ncbi:MAG TPA: phage major capsid protein [Bacteroidia bacterium]|nr:phage major capsid protein [Bacteroidia bacterium]